MKNLILWLLFPISQIACGQLIYDESFQDSSFQDFKLELSNAIQQRDTTILKGLMADRVYESKDTCGYPGCSPTDIIKYYFMENAEESWEIMELQMRFGFSRLSGNKKAHGLGRQENWDDEIIFQAPSYLKNMDSENELIVLGEAVRIRKKPDIQSEVIRKASFEKFSCDCNIIDMNDETYVFANGMQWVQIELPDRQKGYVASKLTSREIYKEMTVAKINGTWKIVSWFQPPGC